MYAYKSDVNYLTRRVEKLEEIISWMFEGDVPEITPEMICEKKGHFYERVAYDLQGGKWGKEKCKRCGDEYSWSV